MVRAKRKISGPGREEYAVKAADMLKAEHPLHATFLAWIAERQTQPTKRQARKFLQAFPHYCFEKAS